MQCSGSTLKHHYHSSLVVDQWFYLDEDKWETSVQLGACVVKRLSLIVLELDCKSHHYYPDPMSARPGYSISSSGGFLTINLAQLEAQYYRQLSNSDLSDQIVIFAGASSDVAGSSAQLLSRQGAQLVLVDRPATLARLEQLAKSCDQVAQHGNKWQFRNNKWQRVQKALVLTLESGTDSKGCESIVNTVADTFGRIDALVFAGSSSPASPTDSITDSSIVSQLDRNLESELLAFVNLTRVVVPHLERSQGSIINLSTVAAIKPVSLLYINA